MIQLVPNVVVMPVQTTLDIPSKRVLEGALEKKIEGVLVIGYSPEGDFYAASASSGKGEMLLLLERAKILILEDD